MYVMLSADTWQFSLRKFDKNMDFLVVDKTIGHLIFLKSFGNET